MDSDENVLEMLEEETEGGPPDVEAILEDYRRRQMLEHLTGPIISVVAHIAVIIVCIFALVPAPQTDLAEVEVSMEELEIKELDPKQLEELQELEEVPQDAVPAVEKPDIPQEATDAPVTEDDGGDDDQRAGGGGHDLASWSPTGTTAPRARASAGAPGAAL